MDQLNTMVKELLEVSPPVALALVINFLLTFLRRVPRVEKWQLNLMAFLIGGVGYPLLSDPTKVGFGVHNPIASEVVTGLLLGGFSIGSNQLFRNMLDRFGMKMDDNGTQIITKASLDGSTTSAAVPVAPTDPSRKE